MLFRMKTPLKVMSHHVPFQGHGPEVKMIIGKNWNPERVIAR